MNLRKRNDSESGDDDDKQDAVDDVAKSDNDHVKPDSKVSEAADKLVDPQPNIKVGSAETPEKQTVSAEPLPDPVPEIDRRTLVLQLFEKRTVGQAFDEAVQRFNERQQESRRT